MSFSLGENLSPLPVSTSTRRPAVSTSRQRVVYSQRLSASHETSFDQSVLGTTPCMARPWRRKWPPLSMVSRASPRFIMTPSHSLRHLVPARQGVALWGGGSVGAGRVPAAGGAGAAAAGGTAAGGDAATPRGSTV